MLIDFVFLNNAEIKRKRIEIKRMSNIDGVSKIS
jgi:hypothetical protein